MVFARFLTFHSDFRFAWHLCLDYERSWVQFPQRPVFCLSFSCIVQMRSSLVVFFFCAVSARCGAKRGSLYSRMPCAKLFSLCSSNSQHPSYYDTCDIILRSANCQSSVLSHVFILSLKFSILLIAPGMYPWEATRIQRCRI
jgi:hypothetical protein